LREILRGLRSVDGRCALALVYTAVCLTVLEYGFYPSRIEARLLDLPWWRMPPPSLRAGVIWALGTDALFLAVPVLIVLFVHREGLASVGWSPRGVLRHAWVYVGLFLVVMVPIVAFAARRPDFQDTYPFVREALESRRQFLLWEAVYLTQFVALEAFFRGYLLFTLERRIGWLSIFVMTVPYCMVHYHKPPLEALAAIAAGLALGALALRYRSFWGGVLLHVLVAASMELLAAHRAGLY
jgi:membrane protease YdiL (CAAX protease family)